VTRPDGSRGALGAILLVILLLGPGLALAGRVAATCEPQRLFHIERSKNANIVAYDALVDAEGRLDREHPLDAYWELLAEKGQRKKLSTFQRKMAYGFKARFVGENTVSLDMAADIRREILVRVVGGVARATIEIEGRETVLERIYVKSVEGGFLPSVEYLDLYGRDARTGAERHERLVP
jgi:hypothetical protein